MMPCTNVMLANVLPRTWLAWHVQNALVRLAVSVLKTNEEHMANRSYHSAISETRITGQG